MAKKLPLKFYNRDTRQVAQDLLGKRLVRVIDNRRLSGFIVETEAYLGIKDPAAHTFGGRRTPRNEVMWGPGGHAYIYFIYGMHFCLNAVTKNHGEPEAVLIRALECDEGLSTIEAFRGQAPMSHRGPKKCLAPFNLANGPGKLCQALNITKSLNGFSLRSDEIFIEDNKSPLPKSRITIRPRIGVAYAGKAALWPLRYYVSGNRAVSRP